MSSPVHLSLSTATSFSLLPKPNLPKQALIPNLTTNLHQTSPNSSLLGLHNNHPHLLRPLQTAAATADAAAGAEVEEEELPEGLKRELMPRHVAVIMDGNVRWARQRGLLGSAGHEAGVQSLRNLLELCCKWDVKVLSVFAFSYDNWVRPKVEVDFLIKLFERGIQSELDKFIRLGIRMSVIGDISKLPNSLQRLISQAEHDTKDNTKFQLIVALSYSGKYDIVQACRNIAQKVKDGEVQVDDINEGLIEQELETNCTDIPYPDLLIRTSGELRISNFLLWQLAYTELFFVRALWPDFGQDEFVEALRSFQQRNRRYGGRDFQTSTGN